MIFPPVPERIVRVQPSPWTDERVELLKKLTEEGLSCSQIARELGGGLTRNAVIGKQHRIESRSKRSRGANPGSNNHQAPTRRYKRAPWVVPGLLANGKQQGPITELPPETAANAVTFAELEPHHCRWPIHTVDAPALFCGEPAYDRHSYCWHHCSRAFSYRPILSRAERETHLRKLARDHKGKAA